MAGDPSTPASPDPLIHPLVTALSHLRRAGQLTAAEMAKVDPLQFHRVPNELLPFIETPTLSKLAELLEEYPWLYWHPLVARQLSYLARLPYDEEEWARRGWKPGWDGEAELPPVEAGGAHAFLEVLVDSHVKGLLPGRRVLRERLRRKPGRKALLRNPHPLEEWAEQIDASLLDHEERALRAYFKARRTQLQWANARETKDVAKQRIARLATAALEDTGAGFWSALRQERIVQSPSTAAQPENTREALTGWSLQYQWAPLNLSTSLDKMLTYKMGRAGRDGRPAYLARAILGALLGVEATRIMDRLAVYRRSRKRARAR